MDVVAPTPPKQPFHLQDGQTKTFTFVIRVLSEWGQPNDWEANLRAHVRLNNRSRPYATGAVPILIRPDVLAEAVKKEEEERSQRHQKQPNGEPPSNK
jgi:hypothetical protein